jgi:hypothetical protein
MSSPINSARQMPPPEAGSVCIGEGALPVGPAGNGNPTFSIQPCPPAGEGVHRWLPKAAWACRKAGLTPDAAVQEMEVRMTRFPNSRNEIEDAVRLAYDGQRVIWHSRRNRQAASKWSEANAEQIEAVTASGLGIADLWEASPIRFDDDQPRTAQILQWIFPGDPWLCVGSKYKFCTMHLSQFKTAADALEQIVPSPMLSKWGRTKEGKESQHTLEATGPRRFLVIEGDGTSKDEQAAALLHLAERAPLSLVVDSGGKSLHGWFFVAGKTDEQLAPFFRRACSLGADKALWLRSQFVRMPDGLRSNGNRQHVLFFNPETITL